MKTLIAFMAGLFVGSTFGAFFIAAIFSGRSEREDAKWDALAKRDIEVPLALADRMWTNTEARLPQ